MTVNDNIKTITKKILDLFQELLLNHSSIYMWNKPDPDVLLISDSGDYAWSDLSQEGKQIQSRLKEEYLIFYSVVKTLLQNQSENNNEKLKNSDEILKSCLEQNENTWYEDTSIAFSKVSNALNIIVSLVDSLYSQKGYNLIVPDTNSLIYNPDIEKWSFDNLQNFTVVLTSTLLSELDSLKINHKNEIVRNKANSLINKIKEYRRRGSLSEGVKVVNNKIQLKSIAVEPNFSKSLPWLDANNNDDRFLASVIEIMRLNTKSIVTLITRDINLQNKAEYSRILFLEPPNI